MRAEQKSLTQYFETVDILINQNQLKDAAKELKKITKYAFEPWSYVALYKRYLKIGDEKSAEKILVQALKKKSDSLDLVALYTDFLMDRNRLDEAENIAEKLKDTKYGSFYSEVVLKKVASKEFENQSEKNKFFESQEYYPVFYDAYTGSKNSIWLINCAVINLLNGDFEGAEKLVPSSFANSDEAYFWAEVLFDAGDYYNSINCLEFSKKLLREYSSKNLFKISEVQQIALESDAYMAINEMENAESVRQELLLNLDNAKISEKDKQILPILMTNSARWALNQGLYDASADLLFSVVSNYPEYVPGLILYTDFAYNSNLERDEDIEMKALRESGLKSLEMEKYDNRRKIPLSDAIYRINQYLLKEDEPYLEILKLDLKYKTNPGITEAEKITDLWSLLEIKKDDQEKFETLLIQYALNYLLSTKHYDDAWNLFYRTVTHKITIDEKRDFWEQFEENLSKMDLSLVEAGGFFAINLKLKDEALRIYEYLVYESGKNLQSDLISVNASSSACMNLGDIYFSTGRKDKALDLYGKLAGRESSNKLRSEIFLRIAKIYEAYSDNKNALRSADYACTLNPENARASYLKDKLKNQ